MIYKYIAEVLEGESLNRFEDRVQKFLDAGWKLQGGISISTAFRSDEMQYYVLAQALVKDEDPKDGSNV